MQRLKNPFTYGDLASDEAFTDREPELAQLTSDLRNGQNVALIAPRRYGKSSLVKAALSRVIAEGVLVVEVDLMTTPTKERFAAKLAKSIHDDVASSLMKAREALRFFSTLRVVPSVTVDLDGSVRFSFAASRGSSDIDATIDHLVSRGVTFARYEAMNQDKRGIWTSPSGSRIAWFLDPDGNNLSVTEFADPR